MKKIILYACLFCLFLIGNAEAGNLIIKRVGVQPPSSLCPDCLEYSDFETEADDAQWTARRLTVNNPPGNNEVVYVAAMFRLQDGGSASNGAIDFAMVLFDSADVRLCGFSPYYFNGWDYIRIYPPSGSTIDDPYSWSVNTTLYVKIHYKPHFNTGECSIYISTDKTNWGSPVYSQTNFANENLAGYLQLYGSTPNTYDDDRPAGPVGMEGAECLEMNIGNETLIFDQIRIDEVDIDYSNIP